MYFALYLTGVPAVGKSTVARSLERATGALRLSYGEILTDRLIDRVSSQAELRAKSATVISAQDVRDADDFIATAVRSAAGVRNVVVDSHALTAESYGLRAVAYSPQNLVDIPMTHVVCLVAPTEVIRERVRLRDDGRRAQDAHDLDLHSSLQASLALSYASTWAVPVAFVRADRAPAVVFSDVVDFIGAHS